MHEPGTEYCATTNRHADRSDETSNVRPPTKPATVLMVAAKLNSTLPGADMRLLGSGTDGLWYSRSTATHRGGHAVVDFAVL